MPTGILSLQGGFLDHVNSLKLIDRDFKLIKQIEDLKNIDSLILPGGESTSMIKIQETYKLFNYIQNLIKEGIPTLGTCAGLILLSKEVVDGNTSLNILDCVVERNAYGRQNQSFEGLVEFNNNKELYCFIRAPKILNVSPYVEKICFIDDETVGIKQDNVVGLTFHPELTNDEYYLNWLKSFLKEGINVRSF